MQLTSQEISQYRDQLATCDVAMIALDVIEDCEGDIEDAATSIALEVGQKVDRVDWLDGMTKRCRVVICEQQFREDLQTNNIANLVNYLLELEVKLCPPELVVIVVIYALKQGINNFCEPLNYKLDFLEPNIHKN